MKVIRNSKYEVYANDAVIGHDISIIQSFDLFFVVKVVTISGYTYHREVLTTDPTTDYTSALEDYYRLGGKEMYERT